MKLRCGRVRPSAATAGASGGGAAAPSTSAAAHGMPRACAMPATAKAVATTSSVLMIMMPRKSRRIERSDVGEALPEEHHRKEDQQHHLRVQLDVAQLGEEPQHQSQEEQE